MAVLGTDADETSPIEGKATPEAVERICGSDIYDLDDEVSVTPKTWTVVFVSGRCTGFLTEVPKLTISKILSMGYGYVA
jgi:hypothetical protein